MLLYAVLDELDWDPPKAVSRGRRASVEGYYLRFFGDVSQGHRFPNLTAEHTRWLHDVIQEAPNAIKGVSLEIAKQSFGPDAHIADQKTLARSIEMLAVLNQIDQANVSQISAFTWYQDDNVALSRDGRLSQEMPEKAIRALAQNAKTIEEAGFTYLIENHFNCWGDTGLALADICDRIAVGSTKLQWDPCNSVSSWYRRAGAKGRWEKGFVSDLLLDELQVISPRIGNIHLRDMIVRDGKWSYVPLGEGIIDWNLLLADLERQGYSGPITLETHLERSEENFNRLKSWLDRNMRRGS